MLVLQRSWYGSCSRPLLRFSQQSVVFHPRTTGNSSGERQMVATAVLELQKTKLPFKQTETPIQKIPENKSVIPTCST